MGSFPTAKVHRPSRRRLGKGQHPAAPAVTFSWAPTTVSVMSLALSLSLPSVISGLVPIVGSAAQTISSQTIVNSTLVNVSFNASIASTASISLAAAVPTVATFQGGPNAGFNALI